MEAIIKANDVKTFQAVIQFLQSLNFEVIITEKEKKSALHRFQQKKKSQSLQDEQVTLASLIGLYNSGISDGSLNHDKEIYGK